MKLLLMEDTPNICMRCRTEDSPKWGKCCKENTTEIGPDILCQDCVLHYHPEGIDLMVPDDPQAARYLKHVEEKRKEKVKKDKEKADKEKDKRLGRVVE